jgi:hypothetical protein
MTIVESRAPEQIDVDLHFIKPFEGQADTNFQFAPEGEGTKVTWHMEGKHNFFGKLMCLFMDMDKMVGGSFESGLADIKKIAEAEASGAPAADSKPADAATPPVETSTEAAPAAEPSAEPAAPTP